MFLHNTTLVSFLSLVLGLVLGYFQIDSIHTTAHCMSDIFIKLMKFISLPTIFLSITSTITQFDHLHRFRRLMGLTFRYTLITTIIAAFVAMCLYIVFNPSQHTSIFLKGNHELTINYFDYLKKIIPDNFYGMFLEGNVIAIVFTAIAFGSVALILEPEHKKTANQIFRAFFEIFIKFAHYMVLSLPLFMWSFSVILVEDIKKGFDISIIAYYLSAIVLSNFIQAVFVIPAFLRFYKISVIETLKAMWPSISIGFFAKSSNVTIPTSIQRLVDVLKVDKKVASFTIPICATINMNGCAAFIYITVLFVSESYGVHFSLFQKFLWVFIATLAAIGNAGVPMGCFLLSTMFLINMGVPTYMMGVILPFYAILDMFETALNVWSDNAVARVVAKKYQET